MRATKLFTVSVATSLLLGAVAHASDAAGVSEGNARISEAVTGSSLPWNVETSQRVSVAGAQNNPEPHWTSEIGTGTAAALERSDVGEAGYVIDLAKIKI
jgi:hypothetical protein